MSVSAEEFLKCCEHLAHSPNEIDRRNCVSRVYYYALHLASRRATELGSPPFAPVRPMTVQEGILKRFQEWRSDTNAVRAGYVLNEMKKRRVLADYLLSEAVENSFTTAQLNDAQRVRVALQGMSSPA